MGLGHDRDRGPGRDRGRSPLRQLRRPGLRVPDLDAVGIFILGNGVHGGYETHRPGLLLQAALQAIDMSQKPSGGQGGEVALGQLNLGGLELGPQLLHALLAGGEIFVQAVLPLDGGEVGDGVLVLVAPGNQRGLGDIEFGGNAGEYPALNAQLNETLNSFLVVHSVLSESEPDGPTFESATEDGQNPTAYAGQRPTPQRFVRRFVRQTIDGFRCLPDAFARA